MPTGRKIERVSDYFIDDAQYEHLDKMKSRFCALIGALPDEWYINGFSSMKNWTCIKFQSSDNREYTIDAWFYDPLPF
jgi:hypothetical protein